MGGDHRARHYRWHGWLLWPRQRRAQAQSPGAEGQTHQKALTLTSGRETVPVAVEEPKNAMQPLVRRLFLCEIQRGCGLILRHALAPVVDAVEDGHERLPACGEAVFHARGRVRILRKRAASELTDRDRMFENHLCSLQNYRLLNYSFYARASHLRI